jgi:hypothetical protein
LPFTINVTGTSPGPMTAGVVRASTLRHTDRRHGGVADASRLRKLLSG